MDIEAIRTELRNAVEQRTHWQCEVDRLSTELDRAQEELRPKVFEMILEKKIGESTDNTCEISEKEYFALSYENKLEYVMFRYFVEFVSKKAKENGWELKFLSKEDGYELKLMSEAKFHWTDYYDLMNTYGIRIIM